MSDNAQFFRDTMDRILADTLPLSAVYAAEERGFPADLFDALRDNGITAMLAVESHGGIGASLAEAMAILRAAGSAAAPGPILETILGQALLAQAGQDVDGAAMSLAFLPDGLSDDRAGSAYDVPWGGGVDRTLCIAPDGEGAQLRLINRADCVIAHGADAAGEPRDSVQFTASSASLLADLTYAEILRQASLLRAAQMLGAMEWAYQRSVEYAMERSQFGREIGKFQAVQHMLAGLADHVLAATVMLEAAGASDSLILAAAARSRMADAADAAISVSHQVHGAMGFSREYALNLRTKRLMAWRNDYGSIPYWRRALGAVFVSESRESLWPAIADAGLR